MPQIHARGPLRIENARLIDGTGTAPISSAVVIADEQGLISYAGRAGSAPAARPDVPVTDAGGGTVLPGFFDCHIHFGSPSDRPYLDSILHTDQVTSVLLTADRLRETLDAGITTARDLGGIASGFRGAVEQGLIPGPRLHTAIRILSHTGGHLDMTLASGLDLVGMGEIVDNMDEVRVSTRRLLRAGADVIKLCATGGMASPNDDPEDEGLYEEEMAAVVEEASRHRGRPVAAHAQGLAGIRAALRAGVTSIEHGYGVDDECCDLIGERGAFLVPTLSTVYAGIDKARMPDWHYQKKTRWSEITKENIAAAIDRKVMMALGTDAPVAPHGQNLRELAYLVDLGMSPMDAIVAGTRNSAALLGLDDQLGTLEVGKLADLVVCISDPLADITVLGQPDRIALVAQQGVIRKNLLAAPSGSR